MSPIQCTFAIIEVMLSKQWTLNFLSSSLSRFPCKNTDFLSPSFSIHVYFCSTYMRINSSSFHHNFAFHLRLSITKQPDSLLSH